MSWQERLSSKMNRTSWKTAHEDYHPHVDDEEDLQSHLMSHHQGDFVGDMDDHEWFHSDPSDYNVTHRLYGWPVENHDPDHYHSNDHKYEEIPNELPQSFASFKKKSDPGSLRGEGVPAFTEPSYQDDQDEDDQVVGPQDLDSNATTVDKFPKSVGVFNSSKIAHLGNDLSHPWPEDTQQQFVDHVLTHHNYHSRDFDDAPRSAKEYEKYLQNPLHIQEEINGHREDHEENGGISGVHPHSHDDWTVLGSKITSSWKTANGGSQFGNPIDGNNNRMQSVESPGLELRYPLDSGKRDYAEQREDANPLTLRSWFTGDDVNGPWPHTKNLSGPLDFEPTDNQNEDSTGPVMSSYQARYSHMEGVNHPWPITNDEAVEHIISHHDHIIQYNMNKRGISRETAIRMMRPASDFRAPNGEVVPAIDAHIRQHKDQAFRAKYPPTHEHDDDDLGIDVPENIETIAPTYVTSSWHEAFVDVIPTNPDEEIPDSLLNPADELKNGRPRANDLPQQSAQLIPGMLIDHDQMGGSGTDSASF